MNLYEGVKTKLKESDRADTPAEIMCGFIGDLFMNEQEDFYSNEESLYDWCEGGDAFRNAGFDEELCKVLDDILLQTFAYVDNINFALEHFDNRDSSGTRIKESALKESGSYESVEAVIMDAVWKALSGVNGPKNIEVLSGILVGANNPDSKSSIKFEYNGDTYVVNVTKVDDPSTLKESKVAEQQYMCDDCGYAFDEDELTSVDDDGNDLCPACGSANITDTGLDESESGSNDSDNLRDMSYEELQDYLTNIINDRESYPEDSTDKRALYLDNLYLDTTKAIAYMDYVKEWFDERDFNVKDELSYWSDKSDNWTIEDFGKLFDGLYEENGINGELFVSYDEFLNNEYLEESGERYQVRKYEGTVAPYGVYDVQGKKFVSRGEKDKLKKECYWRNLKDKQNKEKKINETAYGDIDPEEISKDAYLNITSDDNGSYVNAGIGDHTNLGGGSYKKYPDGEVSRLYNEVIGKAKKAKAERGLKFKDKFGKARAEELDKVIPAYNADNEQDIKDLEPYKDRPLKRKELDEIIEITGRRDASGNSERQRKYRGDGEYGRLYSAINTLKQVSNDLDDDSYTKITLEADACGYGPGLTGYEECTGTIYYEPIGEDVTLEELAAIMLDELKDGALDDPEYTKTLDEDQLDQLADEYAYEEWVNRGGTPLKQHSELSKEEDVEIPDSEWAEVDHKYVRDADGFTTMYTMYVNGDGVFRFVFGDPDLYKPEDDYDWEEENEEAALQWFKDYTGFEEEN